MSLSLSVHMLSVVYFLFLGCYAISFSLKAFVEYDEEASAAAFVTGMTAVPIQIRGRTLFAQYSTHRELKFDKNKAVSDTE
uniref:RRM domain-containing protein n=2 Tax=Caenorhabditis tropicalis TaxID=1561998 RepID=A0A1I7UFS6_9PELO